MIFFLIIEMHLKLLVPWPMAYLSIRFNLNLLSGFRNVLLIGLQEHGTKTLTLSLCLRILVLCSNNNNNNLKKTILAKLCDRMSLGPCF